MFSCPTFLCPGGLLPLLGPTLPCLMLDPDTDLREAPSNWLRRHPLADSLRGFDAARDELYKICLPRKLGPDREAKILA